MILRLFVLAFLCASLCGAQDDLLRHASVSGTFPDGKTVTCQGPEDTQPRPAAVDVALANDVRLFAPADAVGQFTVANVALIALEAGGGIHLYWRDGALVVELLTASKLRLATFTTARDGRVEVLPRKGIHLFPKPGADFATSQSVLYALNATAEVRWDADPQQNLESGKEIVDAIREFPYPTGQAKSEVKLLAKADAETLTEALPLRWGERIVSKPAALEPNMPARTVGGGYAFAPPRLPAITYIKPLEPPPPPKPPPNITP
jgi:hypothetical protein